MTSSNLSGAPKRCCRCKDLKPTALFTNNKHNKDGLNHACVSCQRDYNRRHYRNNKQVYTARARKYEAAIRSFLNQYKEESGCSDCGSYLPHYVMDFDHVRGEKKFNMSKFCTSLPRLVDELNKCEVVCANCHRIRTHGRLVKRTSRNSTKVQSQV